MADAGEHGRQKPSPKFSAFRARSTACTHAPTHVQTAGRSPTRSTRETSRHRHRGVSNPPGRPRDGMAVKVVGVAHAPAPSVPPAKCVSCAAQNAALDVLPLNLSDRGFGRLAPNRSDRAATRRPEGEHPARPLAPPTVPPVWSNGSDGLCRPVWFGDQHISFLQSPADERCPVQNRA